MWCLRARHANREDEGATVARKVGRKVAARPKVSERSERRRPVSETPLRPRRRGARWDRPAPPHTSGGPRHTGHRPDGLPRGPRRYVGDRGADVGPPSLPAEPPGQGSCLLNYRVAGHRRAGVDSTYGCRRSQVTAVRVAFGAQVTRATGCILIRYRRFGLLGASDAESRSFRALADVTARHGLVLVDHVVVIAGRGSFGWSQ